jgi:hypothetical protein
MRTGSEGRSVELREEFILQGFEGSASDAQPLAAGHPCSAQLPIFLQTGMQFQLALLLAGVSAQRQAAAARQALQKLAFGGGAARGPGVV